MSRFGELRALMSRASLSAFARKVLWWEVCDFAAQNREEFEAVWRPYMQGYLHHFQEPLATFHDVSALWNAAELLPFGRFDYWPGSMNDLLAVPRDLWSNVSTVSIQQMDRERVLEYLCEGSWVGVYGLHLGPCELGVEGLSRLLDAGVIGCLKGLSLHNNKLGEDGVRLLAGSGETLGLERLSLAWERVREHARMGCMGELVSSGAFANLESLELSNCGVGREELYGFVGPMCLNKLKRLVLKSNRLGASEMELLASAPICGELEVLDVGWNSIGDDGLLCLVESLGGALRELDVSNNAIGVDGAHWLSGPTGLKSLERLNLARNDLGVEGLKVFFASDFIQRLSALNLNYCDFKTGMMDACVSGGELHALESFEFAGNNLNDDDLRVLVDKGISQNIQYLNLFKNKIGSQGAEFLASASVLSHVRVMNLGLNYMGEAGVAALEHASCFEHIMELEVRNQMS